MQDKSLNIRITDKDLTIELEEYIVGVLAGEMPALFNAEALKAQSIASRSYLLSKGKENLEISSTINDQVYLTTDEMKDKWGEDFSMYYNKLKNIVDSTKSLVIKKNNKILRTYYHAMSNGFTEDSITVFGNDSSKSVISKYENESINNFIVDTKFSKEELKNLLNIKDDYISITNVTRKNTNHVENLNVNNNVITGIDFRKLLKLRSTDFTITNENNDFIITTKGYGHGVGMSQYGANEMAKNGYNYEEILKHYYNDIKIENY